nr:molybdopterin molybdotransferase MoeA [uncultured Cupriavidus sp.]
MLSFDEAQVFFASSIESVAEKERIWLGGAAGRVLARDVVACADAPSADKSAMDGYAIAMADATVGRIFPVQQVCYAGMAPEALEPGHAIRLFTGSVMPAGADTVIRAEEVEVCEGGVRLSTCREQGAHVRRKGEDARVGDVMITSGTVLTAGHIATLASQGIESVSAYRIVEVSLLITGDELSFEDDVSSPHKVRDVNGPMLESMVESLGAIVVNRRHVRDDERELYQTILELAGDSDIVLITGGTSGGERDLVGPALISAGGHLLCHKVGMTPGKPVTLGRVRNKIAVCLPGNPAAAYTTFALLVTPMLRKLQGREAIFPPVRCVRTDLPEPAANDQDQFFRASLSGSENGCDRVTIHAQQGSASVSLLGDAMGFVRIAPSARSHGKRLLPFYALDRWLS